MVKICGLLRRVFKAVLLFSLWDTTGLAHLLPSLNLVIATDHGHVVSHIYGFATENTIFVVLCLLPLFQYIVETHDTTNLLVSWR
jgi:hypothetical protein